MKTQSTQLNSRRSHVLEYKVQPNSQQYDVHTLTMFMLVRVTRFTATDAGAQWGSLYTYGNLTSLYYGTQR